MDRPRRAGLRAEQAAELSTSGRCLRSGGTARRRPVHHAGRREGLALRAPRDGRRPVPDALRAARVAGAQPALHPAGQPGTTGLRTQGQPVQPVAAGSALRRLPLRAHRVPAHRAPHRGRNEQDAALPRGAAARVDRRGLSRARRRARADPPRLGTRDHQPHRRGGAGDGDRPAGAAARAGPDPAPDLAALPLGLEWARHRGRLQRPARGGPRPERLHPGEQGRHLRHPARSPSTRARAARLRRRLPGPRRHHGRDRHTTGHRAGRGGASIVKRQNSLSGPLDDVAGEAGHVDPPPRVGFFTDTSVCIGCKACEVACKEWNNVPDDGFDLLGMSMDNTGSLGASTWRHVSFVEQPVQLGTQSAGLAGLPTGRSAGNGPAEIVASRLRASERGGAELGTSPLDVATAPADLGMPTFERPGDGTGAESRTDFRWLMSSDVCKHCTHAGCLDVCPTGALFRTEFGTVVVQEDICNGCGYCVSGCPYGVIERREGDGRAWKCTLCYDRLHDGLEPACAKACPTQSIQFGPLDELRDRAAQRVGDLHADGYPEARLYGEDPDNGVGGDGAFFLLLDEPEVYGLPPDPVMPTRNLTATWKATGLAAAALVGLAVSAFAGRR